MKLILPYRAKDLAIELGGGSRPIVRPNYDYRTDVNNVDGFVDLDDYTTVEAIAPLGTIDFIYSQFAFEHVKFACQRDLWKACYRLLNRRGRLVLMLPNVDAQIRWAKKNPNGWDGKEFFESASEIIFATQDYNENAHLSYMTPRTVFDLAHSVGFQDVFVRPAGERATDMLVEAFVDFRYAKENQ